MGKVKQGKGVKGSLKWIQEIINKYPDVLNKKIAEQLGTVSPDSIEWLSPKSNDYCEYRHQSFLDLLNIQLKDKPLKDFWPSGGPQWDALGRIKERAYFLVEAKAHISEIISSSKAESQKSKALITKSLNETKDYLKLNPDIDLTKGFYQYSNRLAHLYLLKKLNRIPAYLIFVYFVNDEAFIPTKRDEWDGALQLMHNLLGSTRHTLSKYVIDVFIDVKNIC
jgi:hypothetical protein